MRAPADLAFEGLGALALEADRLECRDAPFPIWLVQVRSRPSTRAWALLSPRERQRAMRFATSQLQGRYVAAHAALRVLIHAYFGIPYGQQSFASSSFGKPQLAGYPQAQFNLSYSGDGVLIGVARNNEIGVDIERVRVLDDALDLMRLCYTPQEQATLCTVEPERMTFHRRFLAIWTRKEACVKASGQGLGISLSAIECGLEDRVTPVLIGRKQLHTGAIQIDGDFVASWARATPLI